MPTRFKVLEVLDVGDFDSQHGKMFGFKLACEREDGKRETLEINAKDAGAYRAGTEFWAEPKGTEYKGVKKYKKVKPPDDAPQSRGSAPSSPAPAQTGFMLGGGTPKPVAMPYEEAALLVKRVLDDYGQVAAAFGAVFEAILDGKIENPVKAEKPKTTVKFIGNLIETAGVNQEQWDVMMPLCDELARLTDDKNVRALLIATCHVQTRKDLTRDNAALFIEALKLNIAKAEAAKIPDDGNLPF